jgi:hypothetical protein
MDNAGLIAAYANASPRMRYQLQEIARIVEDFQREHLDWKTSPAPEFRPIGVRDLTETHPNPASRLLRDRLTPRQVEQLVADCGNGCTIAEAARTYGISPSSVSRLLRKAARPGFDGLANASSTVRIEVATVALAYWPIPLVGRVLTIADGPLVLSLRCA